MSVVAKFHKAYGLMESNMYLALCIEKFLNIKKAKPFGFAALNFVIDYAPKKNFLTTLLAARGIDPLTS